VRDLQLRLALQGDLEAWAQDVKVAMLQGVRDAVEETGREGLELFRDDVRQAGLGDRLPNTWRLEMLPKRGLAYNPAAFIRSAAADIIDAFTRGVTIKSKSGGFLAVPIPGGPMDRIRVFKGETSVQAAERRLGQLVFVPVRQGLAMLVTKAVRQTRSGRWVRKKEKDNFSPKYTAENIAEAVPVFWLVPQVHLARRLNWPTIARQIEQTFAHAVEDKLRGRLAAVDAGTTRGRATLAFLDQQDRGFASDLRSVSISLD